MQKPLAFPWKKLKTYLCKMTRKYPIGLQSFRSIREGGYVYVDKTEIIHRLVDTGKYYFLSRPRRFGKSLLIDTIEELFSGNRELFEGLWIQDHWDWKDKNPVIHFNFAGIGTSELGLRSAIFRALKENADRLGVVLPDTSYDQQFHELIKLASVSGKVVILMDEYDKMIIDHLNEPEKLTEHQKIMRTFYSILKGADEYIRFLLLTGVSRFSKVSIFSDLNNLEDITIGRNFNSLLGITQQELEENFVPELTEFIGEQANVLEKIKPWYNGYSWGGKETLYNPFSLLSFMKQKEFRNYWFATGSPTFLIKGIHAKGEYDFENVSSNENILGNFDPINMLSVPLLFQTGYLTIKSYNENTRTYQLGYPNKEVKDSLLDNLLSAYRGVFPNTSSTETGNLLLAVLAADINGIISALNAVIGSIPYDHWQADTESIFHIITLLTFQKIGVDVQTEVHNNKGRCDVLIKTLDYIYVIELKRDGTALEALEQIIEKNYLQPYEADKRQKIALGISFSSAERRISQYLVREL